MIFVSGDSICQATPKETRALKLRQREARVGARKRRWLRARSIVFVINVAMDEVAE
jgi:hypothetical protein